MKRATTLVLACACSAAPRAPSPLPTSASLARAAPDAAPAPAPADAAPAASACLHDTDATDVSFLDGDVHAIHVCFAPTACFTIERRGRVITAPPIAAPAKHVTPRFSRLTFHDAYPERLEICTEDETCTYFDKRVRSQLASAASGMIDHGELLVVYQTGPVLVADVTDEDVIPLLDNTVNHCAKPSRIVDRVFLVTTDDCSGGNPRAFLVDPDRRRKAVVAPDRSLDTTDAFGVTGQRRFAIIAPHAYAAVLADWDDFTHQSVVDLVPIQAESTPDPTFAATELASGDWLVASATGGVGVVDHTTATLTKTWIIPRCAEAAPATGP